MAAQGLVGSVQYELRLPSDIVWVHVGLATATWLALLWAVAAAGRLVPREAVIPSAEPSVGAPSVRELETVGRWSANRAAPASPPRTARKGDPSLSILVVDDESDLREMLTRSFSREDTA